MDAFGFGSGFQTSFVVAIIVGAAFLTSRLGGDEELLKRGMQVALAFALFLTAFAATTAFIRPPDIPPESSISFDGSQDEQEEQREYLSETASKASGTGTVHLGVGILLAIGAAVLSRGNKVISGGMLFGGVLLLLLGASYGNTGSFLDSYYNYAFGSIGKADQEWDIVRLMVMGIGTVLLLGYASMRWPEPPEQQPAAGPAAEPPPVAPPSVAVD